MMYVIHTNLRNRRICKRVRKTVVHLPSFEGHFKIGLVFALIDGLRTDESIQLICDQNPNELEEMLADAKIPNLQWTARGDGAGLWSLTIEKRDRATGG